LRQRLELQLVPNAELLPLAREIVPRLGILRVVGSHGHRAIADAVGIAKISGVSFGWYRGSRLQLNANRRSMRQQDMHARDDRKP